MTEHAGGLGDAPIDTRFHRRMNGLARALDEWFNGSLRGKEAEANQLRGRDRKLEGLWSLCAPILCSSRRAGTVAVHRLRSELCRHAATTVATPRAYACRPTRPRRP
jgi:hypothetical protein